MSLKEEALKFHKNSRGKIEVRSKVPLKDEKDLTLAYTPGVAEVSREISADVKSVDMVWSADATGCKIAEIPQRIDNNTAKTLIQYEKSKITVIKNVLSNFVECM